jgi:Uma2 family endonuclease
MAIASPDPKSETLTYEQYMAEGEVFLRYDIIDGVRIVTNPTEQHQDILFNIAAAFKQFGKSSDQGKMILAPCDILIRRKPLRTRQPDVLFISRERHALNRPSTDPAPLSPAAELVVEILSPSDRRTVLDAKLADYRSVDVLECWVVSPSARTVEVLRLTPTHEESMAIYGEGETVHSIRFPDLYVAVADIFAE